MKVSKLTIAIGILVTTAAATMYVFGWVSSAKSAQEIKLDRCEKAISTVEKGLRDVEDSGCSTDDLDMKIKSLTVDCDYIFEVLDAIECGQNDIIRMHRKRLVQRLHTIADEVAKVRV